MTQTAKDPASVRALPGHGSTIPAKEKEMNVMTNTTATDELPVRPIKLQLLDIYDHAARVGSLIDALDMATTDIMDSRQRNAMSTACDVLMGQMDDLKGFIETARETLAEQQVAVELSLPDQIAALEKRLAERRFTLTAGASE